MLAGATPQARIELQRLERAWALLDGLPRVELEPSFTQTTVEMIAVSVADDVGETQLRAPRRRWAFVLVMGSLCLGAALAGFVAVKLAAPDPNAALIRDLPVIENVEHYLQGGDVEFLRKLKKSGLFSQGRVERCSLTAPLFDHWQRVARGRRPGCVGNRRPGCRRRVVGRPPGPHRTHEPRREGPALAPSLAWRFAQLDPAEQQRLRAFAAELDQAPDGSELRQALDHYYRWLLTLPGIERAQLLQLEPEQRLDRIKKMKADEGRLAAHRLSASDVQAVSNWLERRVMDSVQPAMRDQLQQLSPPERHRRIVGMIWQRSQSPEGFKGPGPLKQGDLQDLRGELSESARKQLNQALDERKVGQLMGDWVKQALGGYFSGGRPLAAGAWGVSEERLKQFFEHELPGIERQQLLTLAGPTNCTTNSAEAVAITCTCRAARRARCSGGGSNGPRRPMRGPNPPGELGRQPPGTRNRAPKRIAAIRRRSVRHASEDFAKPRWKFSKPLRRAGRPAICRRRSRWLCRSPLRPHRWPGRESPGQLLRAFASGRAPGPGDWHR